MEPIEERLERSLHERADDVEATPALWQEVDRRVTRRRGLQLWSWALAGAAAVAAAVAVVPAITGGEEAPEVAEQPGGVAGQLAPGADLPRGLVLADGQEVRLLGLPDGDWTELGGPGAEVLDVAVRPGTAPGEDLEVAYAARTGDADRAEIGILDGDGETRTLDEAPAVDTAPSVAWTPDGDALAWTATEGDTTSLRTDALDDPVDPEERPDERDRRREVELEDVDGSGPLPAGLRLGDWVLDGPGAGSAALWGTHPELGAVQIRTTLAPAVDGAPEVHEVLPGTQSMLVRSDASPDRTGGVGGYALLDRGEGRRLTFTTPQESTDLPLPDALGDGPVDLDAVSEAVALSDGERAWLTTHAGGEDAEIADLGAASAVSLLRPTRDGAPEPTDTVPAGEDPADAGEEPGEGAADWDAPLLTTDAELGSRLHLLDAATGRTRQLVDLDEDSGIYVSAVAVRPGSTPSSLTAALLVRVDGRYEIRLLEAEDGEVRCCAPLPEGAGIGMDGPAEGGGSMPLPVWSPDGDALAWVQDAGDGRQLRTLAFEEGQPAEDPDAHRRIDLGPLGVERGVAAQDWVVEERDGDAARGTIHLTGTELERSALVEVPVTSRAGRVEVTERARVLGTDVARVAVDHHPADEPEDHVDARVTLEWTPQSSAWLSFGRDRGGRELPDDHREGLDLGLRPWLSALEGRAVTGVGGAAYLVGREEGLTRVQVPDDVGVTHAAAVD